MVNMQLAAADLALVNDALAKVARLAHGDVGVLVDAWRGRRRLDAAGGYPAAGAPSRRHPRSTPRDVTNPPSAKL